MSSEKLSERGALLELRELLRQKDVDRQQLQASYDEALQALADSEAKRETAERELKIAQDQMSTMWKELQSLHQRLDGSQPISSANISSQIPQSAATVSPSPVKKEDESLELCCTLCNEKIKSNSPPTSVSSSPARSKSPKASRLWPFGSRSKNSSRVNELDEHSKVCSSHLKSSSPAPSSSSHTSSPKPQRKQQSRGASPQVQTDKRSSLRVNVTRTPTAATDLAPFKVVTWAHMMYQQFKCESYEVYRSSGDFQWLHDVLQDNCPERVVPPLRTTISLDATVSEYQRFLSRIVAHRTLRTEQPFIVFLTGSIEELRVHRAKFRPRLPSEDTLQYRPTQGRDTSSGALVATKDYMHTLEANILGLVHHLQQRTTDIQKEDTMSHWFRNIAEGEPCDTYLKLSSTDLARTCEMIETQRSTIDGDEALSVQNLQSIADYIHSAVDLLARVEYAVDKFLYWDEEVMLYEAVTSSPGCEVSTAVQSTVDDAVFDDSGVSSISGSSHGSSHHQQQQQQQIIGSPNSTSSTSSTGSRRMGGGDDSISEKWAQASSNCADAKEYLEMICRDLSEELAQFDLRKEQELKQVFLDLAAGHMEKNEKLQGKWYAMRCLLDTPIKLSLRAIQFVSNTTDTPAATAATATH